MEKFQVNPISLRHLLGSIHERKLALPDFQRDFVWDAGATEELIESIARSFPAGSLLFLPYRSNTFSPRAVAGAPEMNGLVPTELILDGQQRMTSLYQAFYGQGEHRYFVALKPLFEGEDIEEAVFYRHRNRAGAYKTLDQQAEQLVVPLGVLFGQSGGFGKWRDDVMDERRAGGENVTELREQIRLAEEAYIKPIEDYRFPVVNLDGDTDLEAVCSIFDTLNRTGVRLSVFDLLAARSYAKGLDLRQLWERTLVDHGVLEDFDVDRYYVLQAIALRARRSTKRGDVLKLSVEDFEQHWDPVTEGYKEALEMLRDECGIKAAKWLPYGYLLVPMAAIWTESVTPGGPGVGANRERLKRWFWCSGLSQTYDRAANTQAAKDHTELRAWLAGGEPPQSVTEFEFESARLREITPRQQSVYKALMALVLRHGAVDFHTASTLTPDVMAAKGVDDHHVFPKAYLNPKDQARRHPQEFVDCVLNRTLIDAETNRRIGKRAPSDYFADIRSELSAVDPAAFDRLLASHLLPNRYLPNGDDSPLLTDQFEAFLDWREEHLYAEILGVAAAT